MTPKERAAMQQALEALESKLGETHPFAHDLEKATAIRALREALAEQATVSGGLCGGCAKKAADGWALYCVECWEKAEQRSDSERMEPVAYLCPSFVDNFATGRYETCERTDYGAFPTYAAPVRTKDLTDDEIDEMCCRNEFWNVKTNIFHAIAFARAVIAAYKEKNK